MIYTGRDFNSEFFDLTLLGECTLCAIDWIGGGMWEGDGIFSFVRNEVDEGYFWAVEGFCEIFDRLMDQLWFYGFQKLLREGRSWLPLDYLVRFVIRVIRGVVFWWNFTINFLHLHKDMKKAEKKQGEWKELTRSSQSKKKLD